MTVATGLKSLKICRITSAFPPPWEGLGPGPFELTCAQAALGHNVTVVAKHTEGCEEFDKGLPFMVYRIRAKRNLVFSIKAAARLISLNLKEPFDVVHGHGESALIFLLLRGLLFMRIPVISSVHIVRRAQVAALGGTGRGAKRRDLLLERAYFGMSDALAPVSASLKEEMETWYGITQGVSIVPNGVNLDVFGPGRRKKTGPVEAAGRSVLFVGVLNGRKGEIELIKAMKKVSGRLPGVVLDIIGDGPGRAGAEKLARELGLDRRVRFISNVTQKELAAHYRAADLFVLPSYSEGLPKVLLEAMACGTTVAVSDIPGHRDVIEDNVTGYLFKAGNVSGLATAILKALKDEVGRTKIASAGMGLVGKKYTWDKVAERLDIVYEHLLSKKGGLCG